jgi:hypothetical protein
MKKRDLVLTRMPLVVLAALIGGCTLRTVTTPAPTAPHIATPAPAPSRTAAITATATLAAATLIPSASDRLPDGWTSFENQHVRLALPPDWQVIELTPGDAQAALEDLKRSNPQMAGIIGGPDALQDTALWAFGPTHEGFSDSLNIRQSPLGAAQITDMQEEVLDLLLPQLKKAGFDVSSTDAGLRINGLPAAHISYTIPGSTTSEQTFDIRGHQYLVLAGADLWILSYSSTPERDARMAPIFEQSARSFQPQ